MYGKYIIATDEALEGYKFEQSCMARCNTVSEFVAAINDFKDDNSQIIPSARQLFQDLYSYSSSVIVIKNLLKTISMRIGLLTYHWVANYGANLQALSTYCYLDNNGYNPISSLNWAA